LFFCISLRSLTELRFLLSTFCAFNDRCQLVLLSLAELGTVQLQLRACHFGFVSVPMKLVGNVSCQVISFNDEKSCTTFTPWGKLFNVAGGVASTKKSFFFFCRSNRRAWASTSRVSWCSSAQQFRCSSHYIGR